MKALTCFVALAIAAGCLFGAPHALRADESPLVINTGSLPPMTRDAQGRGGHHERMLDEMFGRIGLNAELIYMPAERALVNADRGIEDGNMPRLRFVETLYANLVAVPEPVMDFQFAAFTRDPNLVIEGWESFSGRDVAFITGWKILEQSVTDSASVQKVTEPAQLFALLEHNRTEVVIYEKWQGLYRIRQEGLDGVHMVPLHLPPRPMFLLLNQRHRALLEPLAEALRAMKADGTYRRIIEETLIEATGR